MTSRVDPAAQLAQDRLGLRQVRTDPTGEAYEAFRPIPEIAAMRESIRERVQRLAKFRQARFVPVRSVETVPDDPGVIEILSDYVPGLRLSDLLGTSEPGLLVVEPGTALTIVRELLAALALLHESRRVTHGAISPERIIITREGRVVVSDYVFGLALERLRIPRSRLWSEFRIPMPAAAGKDDGVRSDLTQIGVVAVALLAGRQLDSRDYPRGIPSIIRTLKTSAGPKDRQAMPAALIRWLESVLGLESRSGITTARQAQFELEAAIAKHAGLNATASSLKTLAARHQSLIEPPAAETAKAPAKPEPVTIESLRREAELTLVPRLRPRKNLRLEESPVVSGQAQPAIERERVGPAEQGQAESEQILAEAAERELELRRDTPVQIPADIAPIITAGEALVAEVVPPAPAPPRAVSLQAADVEPSVVESAVPAPELPREVPVEPIAAAIEPVVAAIEPVVAQVVAPPPISAPEALVEPVAAAIEPATAAIEPVVAAIEPVVAQVVAPPPLSAPEASVEPVAAPVEPVVAEAAAPAIGLSPEASILSFAAAIESLAAEITKSTSEFSNEVPTEGSDAASKPTVAEAVAPPPELQPEPAMLAAAGPTPVASVVEPIVAEAAGPTPIASVVEPIVAEAALPEPELPTEPAILSFDAIESLAAEIAASAAEFPKEVRIEPSPAAAGPAFTKAPVPARERPIEPSMLSVDAIESLAAEIAASATELAHEVRFEPSAAEVEPVVAITPAPAPELPVEIPIQVDAAAAHERPVMEPRPAPAEAAFDAVAALRQAGPAPASFVELPTVEIVPPYQPQTAAPSEPLPAVREPEGPGIPESRVIAAGPNLDDERIELRFEEGLSDSLLDFSRREWFADDDRARLPDLQAPDDRPAADRAAARDAHPEAAALSSLSAETPDLESPARPTTGIEVESALSLAGNLSRRQPLTPSEERYTASATPDDSLTIGDPNISHAWAPDHDRPEHLPSEHAHGRYPSIAYRPPRRTSSHRRPRASRPALGGFGASFGRLVTLVSRLAAGVLHGAAVALPWLVRGPVVVVRGLIAGAGRFAAASGTGLSAAGSLAWRLLSALARGLARVAVSGSRAGLGGLTWLVRGLAMSIRAVGGFLLSGLAGTARGTGRLGRAAGTTGVRGIADGGGLLVRMLRAVGSAAISPLEWMWRRAARRGFPIPRPQYLLMGLIVPLALQGIEVARERLFREDLRAGTVRLDRRAGGLSVFIDGVAHGKGPFELRLSSGTHRLEFAGWWLGRSADLEVKEGQEVAIASVLRRWSHAGSLRVVSQPDGAQVLVDGVVRGISPLSLDDVSLGTHLIAVRGPSGTVSRSVNVTADGLADIVVPIYSGWIAVFAPVQLDILDGGNAIGTTENGHLMVDAGEHTIELVSERLGFRSTRKVLIKPGEVAAVNVELPQVELEIVAPAGAEILIDGQSVGTAPLDPVQVSVGTRDVAVRHASFGERHQAVTITYRSTNKVVFNPPE